MTKRVVGLLAGMCLVIGCGQKEGDDSVIITITSSIDCDNADTGPNACFCASPDPASVSSGKAFKFKNEHASTFTIMDGSENAIGSIPITTLEHGESSSALHYDTPGVYYYYAQTCPPTGLHANRHTINVLVD